MHNSYEFLLSKLFYVWLAFLLLIFIFLIPPFQKPDEINHFLRATALAEGEIHCITNDSDKPHFLIPHNFYELSNQMSANVIRFRYNDKFPLHALINKQSTDNHTVKVADLCGLPFPGYLANVSGISIGLLFNNPLLAFYLGRIAGGTFFLICFFTALKIIPKNYKAILYIYASIPMVVHQVTAISYDSMQLSLLILVFSLFLKFLTVEKITKLQLTCFLFLIALFAVAKSGYYFIGLLFFAIPYKKFTSKFLYYILPTIAACVLAAAFVFLSTRVILTPAPGNHYINPQAQVRYLLQNPMMSWHIAFNTLQSYGDFYYESLIAYFGWIDFQVNYFIYIGYTIALAGIIYFLIEKNKKPIINKKQLSLLFFIIISTSFIIFISQYLSWSPVGSPVIHGVQGRYFLVLLPLTIFCIVQFAQLFGKRNFYILIVLIFSIFLMLDLLLNIYNRYYHYKGIYLNSKPFTKIFPLLNNTENTQYIPIDKSYTFILTNKRKNNTIDGFTMVVSSNKSSITTLYHYTMQDAQCNHTLRTGYIDTRKLQHIAQFTQYQEIFSSPVEKGNKKLCITIKPITDVHTGGAIQLVSFIDTVLFEPLYNK